VIPVVELFCSALAFVRCWQLVAHLIGRA